MESIKMCFIRNQKELELSNKLHRLYCDYIKDMEYLEYLHDHKLFKRKAANTVTRENDQDNFFIKFYYDYLVKDVFPIYKKFIKCEIVPILGTEKLICQTIPNLRIHAPGSVAVGEYHKDKWYRDEQWSSAVQEWNVYLPLTQAYNTSTIWAESKEDRGDYRALDARPGIFYIWDGSNLMHGNKPNQENYTRVSFDFRIMLKENYTPLKKGSINTNSKFEVGDYYFDFSNI